MSTGFAIVVTLGCVWISLGLVLSYKFLRVLPDLQTHFPLRQRALWWILGPILAPIVAPVLKYQERQDRLPKKWDVFLSYSHWDCLWASALFGIIRFSRGEVFLDYVVIQRGTGWKAIAEAGIRKSDIVLFLDSADSRASENVQHEMQYRATTYGRMSQYWQDKTVGLSFPSKVVKDNFGFERKTGAVTLRIPDSPHPSAKYETPHGAASESVGNMSDWLAVNLPAVEMFARLLGLRCPSREALDPLMRQYLEWAAGRRTLMGLADEQQLNAERERLTAEIDEAATRGDIQATRELIGRGADITSDNARALPIAARNGHLELVRTLLAAGANRESVFSQERTALILALMEGHTQVALELMAANASLDHADKNGKTPLMWAADLANVTVVRALVERGAQVSARDYNGQTALDRARKRRLDEIVAILERANG